MRIEGLVLSIALCALPLQAAAQGSGHISGMSYWDRNANRSLDSGEPGMPNQRIRLVGTVDTSAITDADGSYSFTNLPLGTYLVLEDIKDGWIESSPDPYVMSGSTFYWIKQSHQAAQFKRLLAIAADAYQYRLANRTYVGYAIPSQLTNDEYGSYRLGGMTQTQLRLQAQSSFGFGYITSVGDTNGLLSPPLGYAGGIWAVAFTGTGQIVTGKNFGNVPFEIRGKKFLDVRDSAGGLGGWTVRLHGPIDTSAVTDAEGNYAFRDFPSGIYTIMEDSQPGWRQTLPPVATLGDESLNQLRERLADHLDSLGSLALQYYYTLASAGGGDGSFLGFAIPPSLEQTEDAAFSISTVARSSIGLKASPAGVPGEISVYYDSLHQQSWSQWGVGYTSGRTRPGAYRLRFDRFHPSDWLYQSRTLLYGIDNLCFGGAGGSEISGRLFSDRNVNGKMDRGEPGLNGWKVCLGGPVLDSTFTDSAGCYRFVNLPPGVYGVSVTYRLAWSQTSPPAAEWSPSRDSVTSNFNALLRRLHLLAGDAVRFMLEQTAHGGGGNSFIGYMIPQDAAWDQDGIISIGTPGRSTIPVNAASAFGFGSIGAVADSLGRLNGIVSTGSFMTMGIRLVDTDSARRSVSGIDFGFAQPPASPDSLSTAPPSPSSVLVPLLRGRAEPGSVISVYRGDCGSILVATGAADSSGWFEIQVNVQPNTQTMLYAIATTPAGTSGCSNPLVYLHDGISPPSPRNLSADPFGGGATLRWDPDTAADLVRYRIYASQTAHPTMEHGWGNFAHCNDTEPSEHPFSDGHLRILRL